MKTPTTILLATALVVWVAPTTAEFLGSFFGIPSNASTVNRIHVLDNAVGSGDHCMTGHNIDLPGNDLANFKASTADQCCGGCKSRPECLAYTWTNHEGGTCWLKNRYVANTPAVIKIGADSCFLATNTPPVGIRYYGCDMPGNDLTSVKAFGRDDSMLPCAAICAKNPACKAFTWTDYQGGTCWLKKDVRECVASSGATSAVVFGHEAY